jgi:uncharacterized protein (AIM24 family)
MYMSSGTDSELICGSVGRCCAGESCCRMAYVNNGNEAGILGITPSYPAKIIPIHLPSVGDHIVAKRGSYMASLDDVEMTCDPNCSSAGCCGGLGLRRQNLRGKGTVFLSAGGTIVQKSLKEGEKVRVDSGSIIAYQNTVNFGISFAGNIFAMCCGGEGCFNTTVEGPGLIILQSMNFAKFVAAVTPPVRSEEKESNVE